MLPLPTLVGLTVANLSFREQAADDSKPASCLELGIWKLVLV